MTYYVETYRPAFPTRRGLAVRVHNARGYSVDVLSPSMTAVFHVDACRTKGEALAAVVEFAAGIPVSVRKIMGGRA